MEVTSSVERLKMKVEDRAKIYGYK